MDVVRNCVVTLLLSVPFSPVSAQMEQQRSFGLRLGFITIQQSSRCLANAYLNPGMDFRTGGRWFVSATVESFLAGGAVEDCLLVVPPEFQSDGGVVVSGDDRLDFGGSGSAISAGGGLRMRGVFGTNTPGLRTEISASAGLAHGYEDFESRWLPAARLSVGIAADPFELVWERRWFNTPSWRHRYGPGEWDESQLYQRPETFDTVLGWRKGWSFAVGFRIGARTLKTDVHDS